MRRSLMLLLLVCSSFGSMSLHAQIDSSWLEFFPLHQDDEWQRRDEMNTLYWTRVVVADTVLFGHHWAALGVPPDYRYGYGFWRIDSVGRVRFMSTSTSGDSSDTFIYWLGREPGTIWPIALNITWTLYRPWFMRYDGIALMRVFGQWREVMRFTPGAYREDFGDTIWINVDWLLARGIGVIREETVEDAYQILTGAIIEGVQYGTIVSAGIRHGPPSSPEDFLLEQNYPNPFNSTTRIGYHLSRRSPVRLTVFNALGEQVALLVSGTVEAGNHEVTFEAGSLPSGLYFCRLVAGDQVRIRKAILIR